MSLLGRLEDLSLPDIVQIVHLSRRTGVLEIIDSGGRKTVYFNHGLVVNACSPEQPDLAAYLVASGRVREQELSGHQGERDETLVGDFVLAHDLMTPAELASAIQARILSVVEPLVNSREGEFNFLLSERLDASEIEYDSDALFREGGLTPQKILGLEGERVRPLQGLEESMRAGKALLRGGVTVPPTRQALDLGIGGGARSETESTEVAPEAAEQAEPAEEESAPFGVVFETEEPEASPATVEPQPIEREGPLGKIETAEDAGATAAPRAGGEEPARDRGSATAQFRVGGEPTVDEMAALGENRNIVLYEKDPLVRVAAKRAFSKKSAKVFQFGTVYDARVAVDDLLEQNRFFVTFLDLSGEALADDPAVRLLFRIKRKNRHLPAVVIDAGADLRRRHAILEHGADLYLTRPSEAHLQPGLAEKSLAMFADELTLFAEKAFLDWEQLTGTLGGGGEVGERFYDIAQKERLNRSLAMVRQLIDELSNPNDIREVARTILRLSSEYADRGALFLATHRQFVGLAGYGPLGQSDEIDDRVSELRFRRDETSVLKDVTESRALHRGKLQRSSANVALLESLGTIQPTEIVAIPILQDDRVLGVLYGDNAEQRAPIDDTGSLEFFLAQAAFAFENAVIASARRQGTDWD